MSVSADSGATADFAAGPEKYDNDGAVELFEAYSTNRAEKETAVRKATERQRRIERALATETVALPLGSEQIEFRLLEDRGTSQWAATVRERIQRLEGDDFETEFDGELDRVYGTLGDRAQPEWATQGWFEQNVRITLALNLLVGIVGERDLTAEDIDSFRGQR